MIGDNPHGRIPPLKGRLERDQKSLYKVLAGMFSWDGGKKNWLHPQTDYAFEVSMSEPNGGSDLSTVTIS